jgi:hypothetical protein
MERPSLDGLVDRPDQHAMLGLGDVVLPLGDRDFQAAEVGLDRGGVAAVLQLAMSKGARVPAATARTIARS